MLAYMGRPAEAPRRRARWRPSDDLAHLAPVPRAGRRRWAARSRRCCCSSPTRRAGCRTSTTSFLAAFRSDALAAAVYTRRRRGRAVRAGDRRRLLGRAARRPRARGRHAPARVDAVGHAHALAGDQARSSRGSRRWPRPGVLSLILNWWSGSLDQAINAGQQQNGLFGVRADRAAAVRGARHHADRLHRVRARPRRRRSGSSCAASCPRWRSRSRVFVAVQIVMPMFVREHLGASSTTDRRSPPRT